LWQYASPTGRSSSAGNAIAATSTPASQTALVRSVLCPSIPCPRPLGKAHDQRFALLAVKFFFPAAAVVLHEGCGRPCIGALCGAWCFTLCVPLRCYPACSNTLRVALTRRCCWHPKPRVLHSTDAQPIPQMQMRAPAATSQSVEMAVMPDHSSGTTTRTGSRVAPTRYDSALSEATLPRAAVDSDLPCQSPAVASGEPPAGPIESALFCPTRPDDCAALLLKACVQRPHQHTASTRRPRASTRSPKLRRFAHEARNDPPRPFWCDVKPCPTHCRRARCFAMASCDCGRDTNGPIRVIAKKELC
jgi:hypothetical protein